MAAGELRVMLPPVFIVCTRPEKARLLGVAHSDVDEPSTRRQTRLLHRRRTLLAIDRRASLLIFKTKLLEKLECTPATHPRRD
jgi:hypothetical protein